MHATPPVRMHATPTRARHALPALITGIIAILLLVMPLFAWIAGAGALTLAGLAWADIRSHDFGGEAFALIGAILGVSAIVLSLALVFLVA